MPEDRPDVQDIISKIESVKSDVISDPSVQNVWETLNTRFKDQRVNVDERTMASRDMVKELTLMNLNAQNAPNITDGTGLHFQQMSNLCCYFATMSAVRHEMKKIFVNLISTAINTENKNGSEYPPDEKLIPIPAGKSIDELFKEKEFNFQLLLLHKNEMVEFPNALSFERMLSVLLGCVSPRALSGLAKTLNIHLKIVSFFENNHFIGFFAFFKKQ